MKLYVAAGVYVGTQAEAKEIDRGFKPEEVPVDKQGLIDYLNRLAHGAPAEDEYTTVVERQDPPVHVPVVERLPAPRIETSIALDEAFAAAPIGQQLTLGAIAMENAYKALQKANPPKLAPQGYGGKAARSEGLLQANASLAGEEDELFA